MDQLFGIKVGFIVVGFILLMVGSFLEARYCTPSKEYTVGLALATIMTILHTI